jgi:hypothetical protein
VRRRGHDLPLVAGALQSKAGAFVCRRELGEGALDRAGRATGDAPELIPRDRLLGDEEDRFDRVG